MNRPKNYHRRIATRRGSLIVEVAVATALLAATIVALGRLSTSSTRMQIQAQQRLSARLAADNVWQHLRGLSLDEIDAVRERLKIDPALTCGCDVEIAAAEVKGLSSQIIRVTIQTKEPAGEQYSRPPVVITRWSTADGNRGRTETGDAVSEEPESTEERSEDR